MPEAPIYKEERYYQGGKMVRALTNVDDGSTEFHAIYVLTVGGIQSEPLSIPIAHASNIQEAFRLFDETVKADAEPRKAEFEKAMYEAERKLVIPGVDMQTIDEAIKTSKMMGRKYTNEHKQ